MTPSWEWTEADLLALIRDQVQEGIDLDYKACDALQKTDGKKKEISKDVSALANSAGGTLVYGLVEQGHLPVRLDGGYDPADISREWLEQVINSTIHRRIDGVRITPVALAATHPGRVAYVVSVPQSLRAPHQAADKKFYKRLNFQSVPMEEYEIRDVARRADRPVLALHATDAAYTLRTPQLVEARVQFQVVNRSNATASFAVITVALPRTASASFPSHPEWRWIEHDDAWKVARCVIASGSSNLWSPITPGFTLVAQLLTLNLETHERDLRERRVVGLARLDHDGGTGLCALVFRREGPPGSRISTAEGLGAIEDQLIKGMAVPDLFNPRLVYDHQR